jgi:hypothetical protein
MFLRKLITGAVAIFLACAGMVAITATPASAAGVCEGPVRDNALLFAGWHARIADYTPAPRSYWAVVDATQRLASVGAEVRVVTQSENREDMTLSKLCPQWFSGDQLKPNFIVFVAVKDVGWADVLYGSQWKDKLDAAAQSSLVESDLVREVMTPPFYNGEYSKGFVDAIDEVHRLIDGRAGLESGRASTGLERSDSSDTFDTLAVWVLPVGAGAVLIAAVVAFLIWRRRGVFSGEES